MSLGEKTGQHFHSLSFGDKSVFLSRFPVALDKERVRDALKRDIPPRLDSIFAQQGSSDSFVTERSTGNLPLYPFATHLAIDALSSQSSKQERHSRNLTLEALTDGATLLSSHIKLVRDNGTLQDFSLVIHGKQHDKPVDFELSGIVNSDKLGEDLYTMSRFEGGEEVDILPVDHEAAQSIVFALQELHHGQAVESLTLDGSLFDMAHASGDFEHTQVGTYDIQDTNLTLSLERTKRIQGALAKTTKLAFVLLERTASDEALITRNFSVRFDDAKKAPYKASLNFLVESLDPDFTHEEREDTFESFSLFFRQHPELLFESLASATKRLAEAD